MVIFHSRSQEAMLSPTRAVHAFLLENCPRELPSPLFFFFFFFWFCMFSNPTSHPRRPIGSVLCVPSYTLCSPAFKGVTRRMSLKHTSPPPCYPWYMQVQPGAWRKPTIWEIWLQVPRSGGNPLSLILLPALFDQNKKEDSDFLTKK